MNRHQRRAYEALTRTVRQLELGKQVSRDCVPECPCGHCGKLLDGATTETGVHAKPGDIAVCIYCAGLNTFREDLTLEPCQMADLKLDEDQQTTLTEYRRVIARARPS